MLHLYNQILNKPSMNNRAILKIKYLGYSTLLLIYGFHRKINSQRYPRRMCTLVLLLMLCFIFCNCSHFYRNSLKENVGISDSLLLENVNYPGVQFNKDSMYVNLILKIKGDSTYTSIIHYVVDNIIPEYYMKDYCYVGDEPFFNEPLHNLSKISVNDQTLVIAEFDLIKQRYYFLLNKECQITDHIEFTSYRERINQRKICDWNRDGNQDIIEQRNYCGQLFSSTTEIVYSTINDKFERIFSLEIQEVNYATLDKYRRGSLLHRTYEQKQQDLFRISEKSGYVNGDADISGNLILPPNADCRYYEMTKQELLDKFGTQYEKSCDND